MVDADFPAGLKIPCADHRRLSVQHRTSRQAAADRLINLHRVHASLDREHQRLRNRRDIQIHNDLVGQLGYASAAAGADQKSGRPKHIKIRLHRFKILFLAPAHNG